MARPVKVLIVDDSAFARSVITRRLDADPDIQVVGVAKDGVEAVAQVAELRPHVVTMDVTMPRMDGLAALEEIMRDYPTPVVMLSALTGEQTRATIRALELGAVDFFLKPSVANPAGQDDEIEALKEKIKVAASIATSKLKSLNQAKKHPPKKAKPGEGLGQMNKVLVIGTSTGGPRALTEVFPLLPSSLPAGVLIVQHMPAGFTRSFAERLDQISPLSVKEAEPGDRLMAGRVLLAPGGYHMTVTREGTVELNQDPLVWGVRPSVDVTMESAANVFGPATLGVVLTGMGCDGTRGAKLIKEAGGLVAVEEESTCAIFGMPRSVIEAGHADKILPLGRMARQIIDMCGA